MPKFFYPVLILSLLGAFLIFSAWSAFQASTMGSQVTDRDYYSKGLKYNSTLVEKRAASVLGWQLNSHLDGHQLRIELIDSDNKSVAGAIGNLSFFAKDSQRSEVIRLQEFAPGRYTAQLPGTLQGELSVRIDFERQGARITRQLLLNI